LLRNGKEKTFGEIETGQKSVLDLLWIISQTEHLECCDQMTNFEKLLQATPSSILEAQLLYQECFRQSVFYMFSRAKFALFPNNHFEAQIIRFKYYNTTL
jgi:hypothetical protein